MPMTGYTIHVRRHTLIELSLTVDEALRITVSGGVLVPPQEFAGPLQPAEDDELDSLTNTIEPNPAGETGNAEDESA